LEPTDPNPSLRERANAGDLSSTTLGRDSVFPRSQGLVIPTEVGIQFRQSRVPPDFWTPTFVGATDLIPALILKSQALRVRAHRGTMEPPGRILIQSPRSRSRQQPSKTNLANPLRNRQWLYGLLSTPATGGATIPKQFAGRLSVRYIHAKVKTWT